MCNFLCHLTSGSLWIVIPWDDARDFVSKVRGVWSSSSVGVCSSPSSVIQTVLFHLHFPPLYTQVPGGLLLGMGVLQLLFYVFVRKGKVRGGVFGVS